MVKFYDLTIKQREAWRQKKALERVERFNKAQLKRAEVMTYEKLAICSANAKKTKILFEIHTRDTESLYDVDVFRAHNGIQLLSDDVINERKAIIKRIEEGIAELNPGRCKACGMLGGHGDEEADELCSSRAFSSMSWESKFDYDRELSALCYFRSLISIYDNEDEEIPDEEVVTDEEKEEEEKTE